MLQISSSKCIFSLYIDHIHICVCVCVYIHTYIHILLYMVCGLITKNRLAQNIFARYVLLWHQDRFRFCVDRVADDWRCAIIAEDRDIMLVNMSRTYSIISVVFMFSCGILTLPIIMLNQRR